MLYWAVGVQPENGSEEPINALIWGGLMGSAESRSMLLRGGGLEIATHSVYRPIGRLLNKLAAILVVDRHWLLSNDPRTIRAMLTRHSGVLFFNSSSNIVMRTS
jgi:hypothetical protein